LLLVFESLKEAPIYYDRKSIAYAKNWLFESDNSTFFQKKFNMLEIKGQKLNKMPTRSR